MSRVCIKDHRADYWFGNDEWVNGCAQCELERMRDRIESLRGLCKTAVGMLRDAGRDQDAETIAARIGDMEP